jgi:hypothetical protein
MINHITKVPDVRRAKKSRIEDRGWKMAIFDPPSSIFGLSTVSFGSELP